jgi:uncharacterized 2Fe-2S/4Fe-4S cluster protein (DUF4445 family)
MAAIQGAISHVKWSAESGLELSVIGDTAPEGLCGSGLMDALAIMVSTGAVDETGRLVGAGSSITQYRNISENAKIKTCFGSQRNTTCT